MKIARLMIALLILATYGSTALASESARLIAPLKDQGAIDGCSWSASAKELGSGFIFLSEYDDSRSLMNIDGSDIELTLVSGRGQLIVVGDVLERTYQASGVLVGAKEGLNNPPSHGDFAV